RWAGRGKRAAQRGRSSQEGNGTMWHWEQWCLFSWSSFSTVFSYVTKLTILGNHPASAWSAGEVPGPTHDRSCLPAFSHPLSRCDLLSSHLPLLCLWCVEGTSSAQRTSSVLSLHRPTLHGEDETKGGRTAHRIMLQGRTPGSGGHHSTEGR